MNITFIILAVLIVVVLFGLPGWNLSRLSGRSGKQNLLWGSIPVILFTGSFLLQMFFQKKGMDSAYLFMKNIFFFVFIIGMMLFSLSVLWTLVGLVFKFKKKTIYWFIVISTLAYASISFINGQRIVVKYVDLMSENISRPYRFVHITDLHSGSTNRSHAQKVVDKITPLNPEFMVITGDFIDESQVKPKDIEPFNQLDFPMYLITGNHEYYLEAGTLERVISKSSIQLIDNMKIPYEELDIIGVNELSTVDATLSQVGSIDPNRYTILLDHQPKTDEVHYAQQQGTELMLSGHTHNGQIWPFSWIVRLQFKYIAGLYKIGEMFLYVNQGTGTYGPKMRFNTVNEITLITLIPKEESETSKKE